MAGCASVLDAVEGNKLGFVGGGAGSGELETGEERRGVRCAGGRGGEVVEDTDNGGGVGWVWVWMAMGLWEAGAAPAPRWVCPPPAWRWKVKRKNNIYTYF